MNPGPSSTEQKIHGIAPAGGSASPKLVNPNLTANLSSDYEALKNDVQQAQDLAADFQRQLAGKSNEFAQLKQLFEKTQSDLAHLQTGIVELRAERHRLANEAMRATAFELKLARMTEERDKLQQNVERLRLALEDAGADMERAVRERDAEIAILKADRAALIDELAGVRRESDRRQAASRNALPRRHQGDGPDQFIEISFDR